MRAGPPPFQFDMSDVLARLRRTFGGRVGDVTLNLPFISIAVSPKDRERQVAREIIIRLKDRRVLDSQECCRGCIQNSLGSLQDIRRTLVDKQVELADAHDGALYLLIDAMLAGIRQFLTFEEKLARTTGRAGDEREGEQAYFDALELLRGHLSRCLTQIAAIAAMEAPGGMIALYSGPWPAEAYKPLPPPS